MAYIVPSVLVYQQLQSSGGVANVTPDLDTCIIGPSFNILTYDGTVAGQVATAALSTASTTASIVSGLTSLTGVVAPGNFSVNQKIVVAGAGAAGANLIAVILSIAGNVFNLDTAAGTTVTSAAVNGFGQIANPLITNTFALPGQKAGQIVTINTITPYFNNAKVETVLNGSYSYHQNNTITINTPSAVTGSITGGLTTLTISTAAMATQWAVGDVISVANAGAGGNTPLQATISAIAGTAFTLNTAAITTAVAQAVTKVLVSNLNSTTNTLRAEAGDQMTISYTSGSNVASTFSSNIQTVNTTSGVSGNLVSFTLNDAMPIGTSRPTCQGTVGAASTAMVVDVATGFATGDTVQISGANTGGTTLETTITVSGTTFTLAAAAVVAVTNTQVVKVTRTTAGVNSGTTVLTTIAGSGSAIFTVGDRVIVQGAGANAADLLATVNAVAATSVTLSVPTVTTTVGGTNLFRINNFQISVRKTYNNQQVASTKPISGGSNFDTSTTTATGNVVVSISPELVYGLVKTADVYFGYQALRTDLAGTINTFNSVSDVSALLGVISDANPLALALQVALANSTGRIFGIGIASNDLTGHQAALTLTESQRLYSLVPLTQDKAILAAYQTHVDQNSLPVNAMWRIALVNTAIPTSQNIGTYSSTFVNSNTGNNTITSSSGNFVLTASNATFIADGVTPGDIVTITASTPGTQQGTHVVNTVVSNQQLVIVATGTATAVSYYVSRTLTKTQQAATVAANSAVFADRRVTHVQPDTVGITVNGVVKYLPGYYLCAALGGMVAGFPVQQGFTNIGVAGISDLKNSNFYFSRADLNTIAASGTFIFAQATQGGIPYVRHELTTDMSVLQYRELLVVKNWDFLSYYFRDKMTPFIGSWNITRDTLNTMRQTLVASAELLLTQKLPKIGPPLLSYNIQSLAQDKVNQDTTNCNMLISVVYPNNYMNLFLIL